MLFIQQTIEQDDGCFHFVGRDFQTRSVDHGGNGLAAAPREALPLAHGRIEGRVEEQAGDEFSRDALLLDQLPQSVLHLDVQGLSEFFGEHAGRRSINECFGGGQQRTVSREPGRIAGPQAIGSETSNLTKGIETAAMRVTRQIVEFPEFPEHGEIDIATEGTLQVGERRNFVAKQQLLRRASEEKAAGLIML